MSDLLDSFIADMRDKGCGPANPGDIKPTSKSKLIKSEHDKGNQKSLYYSLSIYGDKGYGRYYDCRTEQEFEWKSKSSKSWTEEERREWARNIKSEREKNELTEIKERKEAAINAQIRWNSAKNCVTHPYLTKKNIKPHNTRIDGDDLLIPRYGDDNSIISLQTIFPNGDKKYQWRGGPGYFPFVTKGEDLSIVFIGEGFATCASIREATGYAGRCAFDKNGLIPFSKSLRKKLPSSKIILCADNDQWRLKNRGADEVDGIDKDSIPGDDPIWNEWREKGYLENIGIIKAQQAAAAVGAWVVWPEFKPEHLADKPKDFNDAAQLYGHDYIKNRITEAITRVVPSVPPDLDPAHLSAEVGGAFFE